MELNKYIKRMQLHWIGRGIYKFVCIIELKCGVVDIAFIFEK